MILTAKQAQCLLQTLHDTLPMNDNYWSFD